jgi:uncharacterized membrane protein
MPAALRTRFPPLLALILLVGAALRLYGLDIQSLWNDELSSWLQSSHATLAEVIEKGVRPTTYPPGYALFLYYVERWLGDSAVALRLPSALAGVLAILATFRLGRRLFSRREGLVAAAILAVSWQPIHFSQEARAYEFLLLFSIVTFDLWFQILQQLEAGARPALRTQLAYALSAMVTTYLHYFGLLLIALQLAGLALPFLRRPRQLRRVLVLAAPILVAYLPWAPYTVEEFGRSSIYIQEPGLHTIRAYPHFLFVGPRGLKLAVLLVFAAALLRVGIEFRRAPRWPSLRVWLTSPVPLLVLWLVLPFTIAFLRSKLGLPILTFKNLVLSIPAAYLLFARALTHALRHPPLQALATVGFVAALLHALIFWGHYYTRPHKAQFREAVAYLAEREGAYPNARIIVHAWNGHYFDYYLERLGAVGRSDLVAGLEADIERTRAFLEEEPADPVWFLTGHRVPDEPFLAFLDRELELVLHEPLLRASVRLYRRRPDTKTPVGSR